MVSCRTAVAIYQSGIPPIITKPCRCHLHSTLRDIFRVDGQPDIGTRANADECVVRMASPNPTSVEPIVM